VTRWVAKLVLQVLPKHRCALVASPGKERRGENEGQGAARTGQEHKVVADFVIGGVSEELRRWAALSGTPRVRSDIT
jgi:hypothetical protein